MYRFITCQCNCDETVIPCGMCLCTSSLFGYCRYDEMLSLVFICVQVVMKVS